jgi:uncharacterized protein (DUF1800 family)
MKRLSLLCVLALVLTGAVPKDNNLTDRQRALHALNRLGFGQRPGDVDRVLQIGVDAWIDNQLHPERIPDRALDTRLAGMTTLELSNADILKRYYLPVVEARKEAKSEAARDGEEIDKKELRKRFRENLPADERPQRVMEELQSQRILRATESQRQLNEVMVDFWMNHFNVFSGKGIDRFLLTSYERDVIRPHIWGHFEDLLLATAKSPAMLFYLDNARSVAAPENRPHRAQRYFARQEPQNAKRGGLNENYAREIMELHTLGVDGGYTQKDVTELARVLTGWTMTGRRDGGEGAAFVFRPALHDSGAKTVLGVHFLPGGGIEEGERMIHVLAHHPATAHHIALQLCQRLVADDPPKALVDRVAKRFLATDGDLRETVKVVISSPEFWDPAVYRGKVKSPFEYVISAMRAVDAHVENPMPVARSLQQIGEPLYGAQPPTGYSDKADAWINTGALINRLNFALSLAGNKLPGVRIDATPPAMASVDDIARTLVGGELSAETRATIASRTEMNAQPATIVGLILGSPEFQRQ